MESWFNCPDCGANCRPRELARGESLICGRCGATVRNGPGGNAAQVAFAFASAGLLCLVLANALPILTFSVAGNAQSNHVISGVLALWAGGYGGVALMVLFCAVIAPTLHLSMICVASSAWITGRKQAWAHVAADIAERIEPWSLVPVFAAACFVAVVKLDLIGKVSWDRGSIAVLVLALFGSIASGAFRRASLAEQESTSRS